MAKNYNLFIGRTKDRLTVLGFDIRQNGRNPKVMTTFLHCSCSCGNYFYIRPDKFEKKKNISCGCLKKEMFQKLIYKDGRTRHPEYFVWYDMQNRCYNPHHVEYERYGMRGISVCDKWKDDFFAFLSDVGSRPHKGLSIDRINNDGNYEPGNCRWATAKEQAANRRPQKRYLKENQ